MKRAMILVLVAILLTGCDEWADYTPSAHDLTRIANEIPAGPTKDAIQGTAVARFQAAAEAQGTIEAGQAQVNLARVELERVRVEMTAEVQSTIAARQNVAQATTQALSARATSDALDALSAQRARDAMATTEAQFAQATATAEARNAQSTVQAHAVIVEATRQSIRATATSESVRATATMQSAVDRAELTRVAAVGVAAQATAQAIERESEIAESRQMLTTFGGWAILTVILAGLVSMIVYLAPTLKARAQVVRRKHDETEPMIVTLERVTMPLRQLFPVLDLNAPRLPPAELQDRTTARAQLANVVSAARGNGRRRVARRPQRPQARTGAGVIRVVEPSEVGSWLEDARAQLVSEGVNGGYS